MSPVAGFEDCVLADLVRFSADGAIRVFRTSTTVINSSAVRTADTLQWCCAFTAISAKVPYIATMCALVFEFMNLVADVGQSLGVSSPYLQTCFLRQVAQHRLLTIYFRWVL